MVRLLIALAGIALPASPVVGQVGLASSGHTLALTATRHASVHVALPGGSGAPLPGSLGFGPGDLAAVAVETAWDLDPSATSALSLVAVWPGTAPAGTAGGSVLFSRPAGAAGARTDWLAMRIDLDGWIEPTGAQYQGTLNLLAITQ
jgi:hypothetical protein